MKSHIKSASILNTLSITKKTQFYSTIKRRVHYQKPEIYKTNANEGFAYHSPLNISRGKAEEFRSKLFFDSPQVPNRWPKYFIAYSLLASLWMAMMDKNRRRQKQYYREQEVTMFKQILPFVKAMDEIRHTAVEQRSYMLNKAIADRYSPNLFEHIRKRFYQEDILVDKLSKGYKPVAYTSVSNFGVDPNNKRSLRSFSEKGLFDNREVGFTY